MIAMISMSCLANEHRVVLRPPPEDTDGALQLIAATSTCKNDETCFEF